jgi:DNA-binding winged helix-turn-helix (wHTH) protein
VVYRFGDFTFDHDRRQLFLNKTELHLSPKAFELLAELLANRSRALSKEELQQRLWPSTFVEETNLAGLVAEIRRALRDAASSPLFIRTVYGFGYHFVGDVTAAAPAPAPAESPYVKLCVVLVNREFVLMNGANVIGRDPEAAIQIDARGVSRQHARILVSGGAATIEDLGSKNGTYVNGRRLTAPARLFEGDAIGLGPVNVTFRTASLASSTDTVPAEGA